MTVKKKSVMAFFLATMLVFMTACGTKSKTGNNARPENVEFSQDDYQKIISGNNEIGFKLLAEVEPDENDNTFISPVSLLMALSMVYNGADGVTKEEIAQALQLEGIDVEELNKANASLTSMLQKDSEKIQVRIANSIWLSDRFHFQDDFAQRNQDYFKAEIEEVDVADRNSPKRINDWVKASTNDLIEEILDEDELLDPDLVTFLVNAIYFKGEWMYAFDEENTEERAFHLADGTEKAVPLMTLTKELAYMENDKMQAVKLPYGKGEMSMTIILPREADNLGQFKKTITQENWNTWNKTFQKKSGTILLPKFQLAYEVLLKDALQKFGMVSAFSKDANFGKLIQEKVPIWISRVQQNTYIDVNEEGTEAAAVTSVEMVTESAPADPPFYMEVNRPFFIAITDEETDAILFMGMIMNPETGKR